MGRSGRKRETSDREILTAMVLHPDPVVATTEVAEEVGMTQQGAFSRLETLEDDLMVYSSKKGTSRVWWPSRRGRQFVREDS